VRVFIPKNQIPTTWARYWRGTVVTCVEGVGDVWVEVDKVIEVAQGSGTAIQRGCGFSSPKARYRAHGLDIGGGLL
jgi:hypothetical protein